MLTLNVGFTKKVGEPSFGSRGAAVNLELELDSSLVGDSDRLKERIRHLFGLAKASVEEELAARCQPSANGNSENGHGSAKSGGGAHTNGKRRDGTRRATASQIRALTVIAERQGIDLADRLFGQFGVRDPAELSIVEASGTIDELKGAAGHGGRR